jgi:beta-fructofuranosidase
VSLSKKVSLQISRREFLSAAGAAAFVSVMPHPLTAQADAALESRLAADPMRPQFHLLPASNWMNDPNGPIYFGGKYHMFCQYNPQAAVWGNMSWYHSVSEDMVHWTHLPLAFVPTPGGPDAAGCFTGSAIAVGSRVYMVYTGVSHPPSGIGGLIEKQCLAYSDDENLLHWTKMPGPIVAAPPEGMKTTGFRDPSAWKQDGGYFMTVGSGVAKEGGCVLLYHSPDMKTWTYEHRLTSGTSADGDMWECPEFFALDGGHVLIFSTKGKAYWQSGRLDEKAMVFHPAKSGVIDLGAFYAPKTQLDAQGQRILWGWLQERRLEAEYRAAGWSGVMSLPRVLNLGADGIFTEAECFACRQNFCFRRSLFFKECDGRSGVFR